MKIYLLYIRIVLEILPNNGVKTLKVRDLGTVKKNLNICRAYKSES